MTAFGKARAWTVSGCAVVGLIAFSASARAEVLFDSLDSTNTGVMGDEPGASTFPADASFPTGGSTFHVTDLALLLIRDGLDMSASGDTFTVSLEGGVPLADVNVSRSTRGSKRRT
jgi:hypothetical protein